SPPRSPRPDLHDRGSGQRTSWTSPSGARVGVDRLAKPLGEPERLVVLALPDIASEDETGGTGAHGLLGLGEHGVVAGPAAAGEQHESTGRRGGDRVQGRR